MAGSTPNPIRYQKLTPSWREDRKNILRGGVRIRSPRIGNSRVQKKFQSCLIVPMTPNSKHWGFVESAVCTSVIAEKLFTRRLGRVQNDDRLPPEKTSRHQYHFGIVLRRKSSFGDGECSFASVGLLSIGSSGFIWAIDDRIGFRAHRLKAFGGASQFH